MSSSSAKIGSQGSNTEYFRTSPGNWIAWSTIRKAKSIAYFEDDLTLRLAATTYTLGDSIKGDVGKRMMEELAELISREKAEADLIARFERLEKRVEHLWHGPNGPGFYEAKEEFENLKKERTGL